MTQSPRHSSIAAALLALAVSACTSTPPSRPHTAQPLLRLPAPPAAVSVPETAGSATGAAIADNATRMIGVPYRYGGKSPRGFDCSGLVHFAHRQAGVRVPRTSRAQLRAARRIDLAQARPGDLLFFRSRNYSHVAIYIGNGSFVHAPSSGKHVTPASLENDYYRTHLIAVGRLH